MSLYNFQQAVIAGASGAGGYVIENAIWLDGAADYLSWTPSSASSDSSRFVLSWWFKRSDATGSQFFWDSGSNATDQCYVQIDSNIRLDWGQYGGDATGFLKPANLIRDTTAWMHVAVSYDQNAGASDVQKWYINGVEVSDYNTNTQETSNRNKFMQNAVAMAFGHNVTSSGTYFNGYVAEIIGIDGDSIQNGDLAITDLCTTDSNGVPIPVNPSGLTFGTNGFWLDFAVAPGTGNGAGTDVSGNGNHWTENSMTAAQQVQDTPSDDAANNVGNYCTLNPLDNATTLSSGNLECRSTGTNNRSVSSTLWFASGKWYFEVTPYQPDNNYDPRIGISKYKGNINGSCVTKASSDESWGFVCTGATASTAATGIEGITNNTANGNTLSFTHGNSIGVFIDADNGAMYCNTGGGTPVQFHSGLSTTDMWRVVCGMGHTASADDTVFNFGQNGFDNSLPSGYEAYKALSTANLPAPTIADPSAYFNTVLYQGNGGSNPVTGLDFQPDFVWIKNRDQADKHHVYDSVRGVQEALHTNTTVAANTNAQHLTSFNSDGFTVGTSVELNTNTENYVAWCMKAGGAGSSNTDGSITSTVSVADHGGFSIVTYTGTGVAGATVGHGLSQAPKLIIVKERGSTNSWTVYHEDLGNTGGVFLDLTNTFQVFSGYWNNTNPTASVFTLGSSTATNDTNTFVAYCFARTAGLIGIGSYTGNANADGPVVVVDDGASGFRPAFLLVKRTTTSAQNWAVFDNVRDPYNAGTVGLKPDTNEAEYTANDRDFLSNGFKIRASGGDVNASGETYIYLAFAEFPFDPAGLPQVRAR